MDPILRFNKESIVKQISHTSGSCEGGILMLDLTESYLFKTLNSLVSDKLTYGNFTLSYTDNQNSAFSENSVCTITAKEGTAPAGSKDVMFTRLTGAQFFDVMNNVIAYEDTIYNNDLINSAIKKLFNIEFPDKFVTYTNLPTRTLKLGEEYRLNWRIANNCPSLMAGTGTVTLRQLKGSILDIIPNPVRLKPPPSVTHPSRDYDIRKGAVESRWYHFDFKAVREEFDRLKVGGKLEPRTTSAMSDAIQDDSGGYIGFDRYLLGLFDSNGYNKIIYKGPTAGYSNADPNRDWAIVVEFRDVTGEEPELIRNLILHYDN